MRPRLSKPQAARLALNFAMALTELHRACADDITGAWGILWQMGFQTLCPKTQGILGYAQCAGAPARLFLNNTLRLCISIDRGVGGSALTKLHFPFLTISFLQEQSATLCGFLEIRTIGRTDSTGLRALFSPMQKCGGQVFTSASEKSTFWG